jgi:PAS domain S-box-containing protein
VPRSTGSIPAPTDAAVPNLMDGLLLLRADPDPDGEVRDLVVDFVRRVPGRMVETADLVGRRLGVAAPETVRSGMLGRFLQAHHEASTLRWRTVGYHGAHGPVTLELQASSVPGGVVVTYREVSEQDVRERALQLSEAQLRATFDDAPAGMAVLDLGLRCVRVNTALTDLLRRPAGRLHEVHLAELLPSDGAHDLVLAVRELVATGGTTTGTELEVHRPGAPALPVLVRVSLVRDTEGAPSQVVVHVIDHGAQRLQAELLRKETAFTSAVLGTTQCPVVVVDHLGTVVSFNPAATALTGYLAQSVVGRPLWDLLVPADRREVVRERFSDIRGRGLPLHHEEDWLTRSGQRRRLRWANAYLTDPDGVRTHVVKTGIDVTSERAATTMVSQVLRAATETSFVATDLAGTITLFNAGAEQMTGYRAEDVVGAMPVTALHDPDELADHDALVAHLAVDDTPLTRDWTYVHRDGARRTVALTVSEVLDAFGVRSGYLGVAEDVTEVRSAERASQAALATERAAVERLRELDAVKTDFVSTVSHELRTPITSVVGYVDMLAEGIAGELTDVQLEMLEVVSRNSQRLLALIEDLLTLSRIESGAFRLEPHPLDVRDVVAGAQDALRPIFSGRRLDLTVDLPDRPVPLVGDHAQLERSVMNLLTNAVKFTADGGAVGVVLEQDDEQVRIEVTDTGMGIPAAEQDRLFTRFFRSSSATSGAIQGTGLGLSIVRSIIQAHGGDVAVTSVEGCGTTVTLTLPLRASLEDVA